MLLTAWRSLFSAQAAANQAAAAAALGLRAFHCHATSGCWRLNALLTLFGHCAPAADSGAVRLRLHRSLPLHLAAEILCGQVFELCQPSQYFSLLNLHQPSFGSLEFAVIFAFMQ